MVTINILDCLTQPGRDGSVNDDCHGSNDSSVHVIDGATGLSDRPIMDEMQSDAAWFARFASGHFDTEVTTGADMQLLIADLSERAREQFRSAAGGQVERYAWPSASFTMLRAQRQVLEFYGLGDCTVYFQQPGAEVETWSPLPQFSGYESRLAAGHMAQSKGFNASGSLLGDEKTLQDLRAIRALQNTEQSGVWTLGLVPEAADHIAHHAIPFQKPVRALLCSDGFSALVDTYDSYSPKALIEAAGNQGLESLFSELRQIEREHDPHARKFPRYKQSDDATAVLVEVSVNLGG